MTKMQQVKGWGYSGRQYALLLCQYLGIEFTDASYMRIMRILKGEIEPDQPEIEAMQAFEDVQKGPHESGAKAYRMSLEKKTFQTLLRYARTGMFNTRAVRGTLLRLMEML